MESVFLRSGDGKMGRNMVLWLSHRLIRKGEQMLPGNVESDLETRLEEEGISQKEPTWQIGVSLPYVNRITRGGGSWSI